MVTCHIQTIKLYRTFIVDRQFNYKYLAPQHYLACILRNFIFPLYQCEFFEVLTNSLLTEVFLIVFEFISADVISICFSSSHLQIIVLGKLIKDEELIEAGRESNEKLIV